MTPDITSAEELSDARLEVGDVALRTSIVPHLSSDVDSDAISVIEPRSAWSMVDFHELWRYRELLYFLIWRDVKVRYKQTLLGVAWAVVQPIAMMVVFSFFLGRMGDIAARVPNYALFVFAGITPWTFFSHAVATGGLSILGNQNLVTKIYFPRIIAPCSAVGAAFVDFLISGGLLVILLFMYRVQPNISWLALPVIAIILSLAATAFAVLLSALVVAHRDFKHVITFGMQIWMFATPCIYLSADYWGPKAHYIMPLNPTYGLIYNFRAALLGTPLDFYALTVSTAVAAVVGIVGLIYFRRVERTFADII